MSTNATLQKDDQGIEGKWTGRGTLMALVNELNRQKETKRDFVADTRALMIEASDDGFRLIPKAGLEAASVAELIGEEGVAIRHQALEQIGERQDPPVPWKFLQRLAAAKPFTASSMLNDLLGDANRRFIRCLDGRCRAFLSAQYRVIDNYDIAFTALEAVQSAGGNVIECSLSDKRMHMTFTSQNVWDRLAIARDAGNDGNAGRLANRHHFERFIGNAGERWAGIPAEDLPGGNETCYPIVKVSNSETGHGGLNIRIGLLNAICLNGLVLDTSLSQIHLGGVMDEGLWTEETHAAESRLVYLKARDAIAAAFNQEKFSAMVAKARQAGETPIEKANEAIDQVVGRLNMPEAAKASILDYFLSDYQRTALGLGQAVARYAQDIDDADDAADMEAWAGEIINKPSLCKVTG